MKTRILFASGVAASLLMACGGSSNPPPPGPSLVVSPKSPAPVATAGGPGLTFTATLTGATDTINWSLTGPGGISPASGTSTTYTPPASVAVATSATLTATAGSLTDSVTITVNPPASITVTGKVIGSNRQPVANAPVVIGTKTTTSGTDGSFTIANVTPPYDLISVVSTPSKMGVVYKGLTRPDPTILFFGFAPALSNAGIVSGNLSGGDPLPAALDYTRVAWGSPETAATTTVTTNPYGISLSWYGPAATTGNLHALQWVFDPATLLPSTYKGFGEKTNVTVANAGVTTSQNIAMTGVTAANIAGSVTVPASYAIIAKGFGVAFSDGAVIALGSSATATASFNFITPASVGGTITMSAIGMTSGGMSQVTTRGLAPNASGVTLAVQAAPMPALPAAGGTGITTNTDFTWTQFVGGVHVVLISPAVATDPEFFVFTTGTTTRIPDLGAQGLGLPAGAAGYSWAVYGFAPFASMDEFAGSGDIYSPAATSHAAISAARTFTTQ